MTKKEFKEAMLRGLGRCIIAVRQEPEKYREIVLWACRRNIAYDTQCEGTRSWYVYTIANAFPNPEPFTRAAEESLKKYRPNGSWDLLHLSELLMFFVLDGHTSAWQALEEKYQEILALMFARNRRPNRVFHELSDLEQLGLVLAVDRKSFLRIAKDFGRLYREKKYLYDCEFSWFYDAKGGLYRRAMERGAQTDEDIACFLQRESTYLSVREQKGKNLTEIALSRWLQKQGDKESIAQYAAAYREEIQPERRAEALCVFACCPYPDAPQPLMQDTYAACEELQNAAWRALENVRHPAVRQFALDNIHKGIRTPENFAVLATNYVPQDAKLTEELLREMIAKKDWDGVHAAGMDIYRAFCENSGIPHPKHLLPLLYEYNPCSCCRQSALVYMGRHRMLEQEMLEECLYDSDDEIRSYARKRVMK